MMFGTPSKLARKEKSELCDSMHFAIKRAFHASTRCISFSTPFDKNMHMYNGNVFNIMDKMEYMGLEIKNKFATMLGCMISACVCMNNTSVPYVPDLENHLRHYQQQEGFSERFNDGP